MSISTELTLLANSKQAIKNSINQKGGSITDSTPFADYSTAIDNLPSGGDNSALIDLIEGDITSINIPSGTTSIRYECFINLPLASVNIPNTVTIINSRAFHSTRLVSVTIPNSVRTVGSGVFQNCQSLTTATLPSGLSQITANLFTDCRALTSITIPDTVTAIGNDAFSGCRALTSITIPSSVISIGSTAFRNTTSTTFVLCLPTTPPSLSNYAFLDDSGCPIYVPAASVDTYKAANNWSTLASRIVAIGDAITFTPTNGDPAISVKNYELATANYVQSTDVPSTIKNGAGSLEICEGVTRIGTFAFQNGSSLTSATLPSTLTRIDEAALMGCTSLTGITINATTPLTLAGAALSDTNNCPIYVPAESVDAYKAASGWSDYASRIVAIPSPSITIVNWNGSQSNPTDFGEFEGCEGEYTVDGVPAASSSSTFDSDVKTSGAIIVEDNNGNDVTSQCTFSSNDYYKWDSTQDPSYDGESEAYYEWRLDTYIDAADAQNPHSATITATYGNLSDTFTIEWTTTSNCEEPEPEPEPDPEEPEE